MLARQKFSKIKFKYIKSLAFIKYSNYNLAEFSHFIIYFTYELKFSKICLFICLINKFCNINNIKILIYKSK